MDFDEAGANTYCGCDITDGKLRILFSETYLGTNISDAVGYYTFEKALNKAEQAEDATLNFFARKGIREVEPEIEKLTKEVQTILNNENLKLNPNWVAVFDKLKSSKMDRDDWDSNLGSFLKYYFEGLVSQLKYQKFDGDDMLQEGFNEVVEKGEIAFRVVDKLEKSNYNECVIEDGVLYLQVSFISLYFSTKSGLC